MEKQLLLEILPFLYAFNFQIHHKVNSSFFKRSNADWCTPKKKLTDKKVRNKPQREYVQDRCRSFDDPRGLLPSYVNGEHRVSTPRRLFIVARSMLLSPLLRLPRGRRVYTAMKAGVFHISYGVDDSKTRRPSCLLERRGHYTCFRDAIIPFLTYFSLLFLFYSCLII